MAREINLNEGTGKSLDQIAALMEAKRKNPQLGITDEDIEDAELLDDVNDQDITEDDADEEEVGDVDEGVGDDTTDDDAGEDESSVDEDGDEGGDEDAGDVDELTIDEDTLIELEGEEEAISLKTLKDVYQADKTIVERVKQTEAAYLEATQARSKALEDNASANEALTNVVKALDGIIGQPLVSKPNEAMKQSDPARYWAHFEAYQNDQQRIQQSRQAIINALGEHSNKVKEIKENFKLREMAVLAQKLPALRDEKTKTQATRDILDAAAAYGFTPEEVEAAGDHRIYQMAYDAQQYRKLKSLGKEEKEEKKTQIKAKIGQQPKVLRSKGTGPDSRGTVAQKRVKVLKARAEKTGRVDDVAAFMASKRRA